jgi:hypothetical protein
MTDLEEPGADDGDQQGAAEPPDQALSVLFLYLGVRVRIES